MNRTQNNHFPDRSLQYIDHPSQAKPGIHTFPDRLYVVTMLENPLRWRARYGNYNAFEAMVERSGAILYTGEVAFGDREFEIAEENNPRHVRFRTHSEIWRKENVLNVIMQHLPPDAKYIAWIDADVQFSRADWAQETLHQLQHYDVVQMFSHAQDVGPEYQPMKTFTGFIYKWINDRVMSHDPKFTTDVPMSHSYSEGGGSNAGHPGYAWAARRDALDNLGMLIDWAILGSADSHMAMALIGKVEHSLISDYSDAYKRLCREWQERATKYIRQNVGYIPGLINHYWHGKKINRAYKTRWKFLANSGFDPEFDLKKDWQGLYQLTDRSIILREGIRQYNRMRNEDGMEM